MFDVVSDVGQYRLFIPWCRRSDILEKHGNSRVAELEIGFPPLRESYQSRIILVRPSVVHSVVIGESIFNTLETTFRFGHGKPGNDLSCTLHYDLVFEFKSALHSGMAHLFFDRGFSFTNTETNLGGIDDAGLEHIYEFVIKSVISESNVAVRKHL
ncbi:polyketide cyclase/dehydrase [Ancylostoma ceylanicum]|uniref:Polyketide cyclase/dehydrase n=1 Tax=Ancylostoma ceylanicum TaxID=53326 RepID=A0A0D6LX16_9BILA|nr:polyketide cyclase/dehydrase [Ancylostoma ceylanicum]